MCDNYSKILLDFFIEKYGIPNKNNVLLWHSNKLNCNISNFRFLPNEIWLNICDFLTFPEIILLSRCDQYIHKMLKSFIEFLKQTRPIAILKFYVTTQNHCMVSYLSHYKIPIYLN